MPVLDQQGRLFGRINVVDAAVLLLVLLLLPLGVATYRVFRTPTPEILKIDPDAFQLEGEHRLRIEGNNLRPYLRAFIAPAGQPPAFVDLPDNPNQAEFLLERPTLAYVELPKVVGVGAYDLYLYDESHEVLRRPQAFTVIEPDTPRPTTAAAPPRALTEFVLRVDGPEELASVIKVGDVDVNAQKSWPLKPPTIVSMRRLADPPRPVSFLLSGGGIVAAVDPPRARLELVVRAGLQQINGTWEFDGRRRMRAGQSFQFVTPSYLADGLITHFAVISGVTAERAARQ
ncbi:MAG: DUF4330 family protein [Acidobacteriia bacterium]|nr:DUF4330 family protein [Terriglobia bacterium]